MNAPGDLVQVDTLDLRPLPGVVLKQFTARDVVCRWDVVEVYSVATARTASPSLAATLVALTPGDLAALTQDPVGALLAAPVWVPPAAPTLARLGLPVWAGPHPLTPSCHPEPSGG